MSDFIMFIILSIFLSILAISLIIAFFTDEDIVKKRKLYKEFPRVKEMEKDLEECKKVLKQMNAIEQYGKIYSIVNEKEMKSFQENNIKEVIENYNKTGKRLKKIYREIGIYYYFEER